MKRLHALFLSLVAATLACTGLQPQTTPLPRPSTQLAASPVGPSTATASAGASATPGAATEPTLVANTPGAVGDARPCAYQPGVSVPAEMPEELAEVVTPTAYPTPALPANTAVDAATNERHLNIFRKLADTIETEYVYPDFNGLDWPALRARYQALVSGGLTDDDFYVAMNDLLIELGDEHSNFESPAEVAEQDAAFAGKNDYVGIGVIVQAIPEARRATIIVVFPGGSAAEAGLRPHDSISSADGQPLLDETGTLQDIVRGPEGTSVTLTVERPGESAREVTLERRRVTGALPIDYCLVPGTRVGYLMLPNLTDGTIPDQVRQALQALSTGGPLAGLIIDNRQNGGGLSTVLEGVLSLFTQGTLGYFVSRTDSRPLEITPEDVAGSQALPLVILVGPDTASYGEVLSGVLQASDQATVVGQTTPGNVETLFEYKFEDGSRAWVARETFQPVNQENGIWEATGIVPDLVVPSRWDLFTEASDPGLAAAVDLLTQP